jgi:hypothetical protein
MEIFEYYLLATFLLGTVQLRHHAATYRLVRETPARWPHLYGFLKEHVHAIITIPTVLILGLMLGAWLFHTLFRRLIWPEATVSPAELREETFLFALAIVFGAAMLVLDLRALFRAATFRGPKMVWLIDVTEMALRADVPAINWLVQWGIRAKLARSVPILHHWMWNRSAEIAARFAFGSTLWFVWVAHGGAL